MPPHVPANLGMSFTTPMAASTSILPP
jgi:hypothetical protein